MIQFKENLYIELSFILTLFLWQNVFIFANVNLIYDDDDDELLVVAKFICHYYWACLDSLHFNAVQRNHGKHEAGELQEQIVSRNSGQITLLVLIHFNGGCYNY